MSDIVERLRAQVHDIWEEEDLRLEAADKIAQIEAGVKAVTADNARLRAALLSVVYQDSTNGQWRTSKRGDSLAPKEVVEALNGTRAEGEDR